MNSLENRREKSTAAVFAALVLTLAMGVFFLVAHLVRAPGEEAWGSVTLSLLLAAMGVVAFGIYAHRNDAKALVAALAVAVLYVIVFYRAFGQAALFSDIPIAALVLSQAIVATAVRHELNKYFFGKWSVVFAVSILAIYALLAIFAPYIARYGETEIVGGEFEPWSLAFPLGTDNLGRDVLTRIIYGARNTISISLIATTLGFIGGTIFGQLAAALGGWVDDAMSRIVDVIMAIPQLILALLVLTIAGTSLTSLVAVIALVDATRVFRLARAISLKVLALDFVEAARARGEGLAWVLWREALPNMTAPLAAEFGVRFCFTFLFISSLSFLGVGVQPPTADWGSMIRENAALIAYGDITPLIPALAIALLAISVNLIIDALLAVRASR